jgi:hypothetical protein
MLYRLLSFQLFVAINADNDRGQQDMPGEV